MAGRAISRDKATCPYQFPAKSVSKK